MARICLVTPGHVATNPRIVKEADALSEVGHDVRVIAADYIPWAREADKIFRDRGWTVQRTLPFGPHAPWSTRLRQIVRQRAARLLADRGSDQAAVICAAWHPLAPDLVKATMSVVADLYVAHYPAALPAAALAARRHGAKYAFDAEDFHLGDFPDDQSHDNDRRLLRRIEERWLHGCAYMTAASPGIADAYAATYGVTRPTVVLNVFPRTHAPSASTAKGTTTPGPSIYWFSQTIGPDRGLECAIQAVGLASAKPHLYLRGNPAAGFPARLKALAAEAGASDRLHVLPLAAPNEMERLAAAYDLGFVGETGGTWNRRIALTNKQFSYLLAGIPALLSDIPAHRDFADKAAGAVKLFPVDDPLALAAVIDDLLDPRRLAAARKAAFELGRLRFNWENEKRIIQDLVGRIAVPSAYGEDH